MYIFWPQHHEPWGQPQEKIWKDHEYMEIRQHTTNESMGQPGNKKKFFLNMQTNKTKDMTVQNQGVQQKLS